MRLKMENIFQFNFFENENSLPKAVREYHAHYKNINDILKETPKIIEFVHRDFASIHKNSSHKGRMSSFTSDSLFRAVIVKQKEGIDYREACIRIAESEFLKDFCLFARKNSIDHTLLCKAFKAISPETWRLINLVLANQSIKDEKIDVDCIRADSTVVESNIHWPTDSSLLWDTYRVIDRIMAKARTMENIVVPYRFHLQKIKKLHVFVTRYASSTSKKRIRQVKKRMKTLIERVDSVVVKASEFASILSLSRSSISFLEELKTYLPSMIAVVSCARRRWINGERVPLEDKVFSIFEPHTELIQRGRHERPIEFGHKIVLSQSKEKFITGYQVLERKIEDCDLLESVIEQHREQYGKKPKALTTDMGFCPDSDTLSDLKEEIEFLEIPRRSRDFSDELLAAAQKFRAGIEGAISCLKRTFRLSKCFFRGFKNFESAIASAIFCHNLVVLAKIARKS